MTVTDRPLRRRKSVSMVEDGDGAVNGILWIRTLAEDEKNFLMDPRSIRNGYHSRRQGGCGRRARDGFAVECWHAQHTESVAVRALQSRPASIAGRHRPIAVAVELEKVGRGFVGLLRREGGGR